MDFPLDLLRRSAAHLMAAAFQDLFPHSQLVGGSEEEIGFTRDFQLSSPFAASYLPLIENRMKEMAKSDLEMRLLEMVPQSAHGFLSSKKQKKRAEAALRSQQGLVSICQIGEWADFSEGPFLTDLSQIGEVALFHHEINDDIVRIHGTTFPQANALQAFIKRWKRYEKENHMQWVNQLGLFLGSHWTGKGERLRQLLLHLWEQALRKEGIEPISAVFNGSIAEAHNKYFKESGLEELKIAQCAFINQPKGVYPGLFTPGSCFIDRAHLFYRAENLRSLCISSLQFLQLFFRMFDLDYQWVLTGGKQAAPLKEALTQCKIDAIVSAGGGKPEVQMRIADGLGRRWVGPFLRIERNMLVLSVYNSLERFVALLLERYKGELPFWLCPEQVRVLLVKEDEAPAWKLIEKLEKQNIRCHLDKKSGTIEQKLHQALLEKVPYVIFLGKRELETGCVTVRAHGSKHSETVSEEAFLNTLLERNRIESQ